jgi:hypothetical protein
MVVTLELHTNWDRKNGGILHFLFTMEICATDTPRVVILVPTRELVVGVM